MIIDPLSSTYIRGEKHNDRMTKRIHQTTLMCVSIVLLVYHANAQENKAKTYPLKDVAGLTAYGINLSSATFKGKKSVRITPLENHIDGQTSALAMLNDLDFTNGVIEVEMASMPGDNAPEGSRGFAGVAFRIQDDLERYECFYLRPTNGRANDQLRRNHSTQYISQPDYPWHRLRKENPGVYESYVDLQPGVWTKIRIEVSGERAQLFVNDADQPVLIVNDLKHGPEQSGAIGLWIGSGTEAYFANLKVTRN